MKTSMLAFVMGLLLCLSSGTAMGQVPSVLNFSGHLGSADGDFTGEVSITLTIWDDATDSDASHNLWSDTFQVQVDQGRFHVLLGADPTNPLPAEMLDGRDIYVGVAVNNGVEMTPRMRVVSVPYAMSAGDAQTIMGKGPDAFAASDHNHDDRYYQKSEVDTALSGKVGHNEADSVLTGMLQDGAVTDAKVESVAWGKLTGVPADLADGDDDTTYSGTDFATSNQSCTGTQKVTGIDGSGNVVCGPDTDTDTDTLARLLCTSGEIAKWDGTAWACAADDNTDSGGDITGVAAGTGLTGGVVPAGT